jgi:hypothetical protein
MDGAFKLCARVTEFVVGSHDDVMDGFNYGISGDVDVNGRRFTAELNGEGRAARSQSSKLMAAEVCSRAQW